MKKLIIILILLLGWLYYSTGRYVEVKNNIKSSGFATLLDEPFWVFNWVGERLGNISQSIHDGIDGRSRMNREP